MRKFFAILLLVAMTACLFAGCGDTVGEIAGNVAQAAQKELENQVKKTLEENKLTVVEIETSFGKLNDNAGDVQFFVAALVKTEKTDIMDGCLSALDAVFTETGYVQETDSTIDSDLLVHKSLSYSHSDFSDATYYTVYAYYDDLSKFVPKGK